MNIEEMALKNWQFLKQLVPLFGLQITMKCMTCLFSRSPQISALKSVITLVLIDQFEKCKVFCNQLIKAFVVNLNMNTLQHIKKSTGIAINY